MRIVTSLAFLLAASTLPAHAQSTDPMTATAHGIQASHSSPSAYGRRMYSARGYKRVRVNRHQHRWARGHGRGHRHKHSHGMSASRGCLTAQTRQVLSGLEARFGSVQVISTCRPSAVIAGSGRPSQHRYGKAVDFMPKPGQRAAMLAWLRSHAGGAVITYGSGHVHFDTGGYAVSAKARRAYARARAR